MAVYTLKCEGSALDTLDDAVAVDHGFLGFADFLVAGFDAAVEDCGGLPFVGAVMLIVSSGRILVRLIPRIYERCINEMIRLGLAQESVDVDDHWRCREDVNVLEGVRRTLEVRVWNCEGFGSSFCFWHIFVSDLRR